MPLPALFGGFCLDRSKGAAGCDIRREFGLPL